MSNRFFIVDYGERVDDIAEDVIRKLRNTKDFHVVTFKTSDDTLFCIEEVQEYEFITQWIIEKDLNDGEE